MSKAQKLANKIAELNLKVKDLTAKMKDKKQKLIEIVGTEGEKFTTDIGTVSVTKATKDRPSGNIVYKFNVDTFLELDEHIQANLIKQGIVEQQKTIISGQKPTVKVTGQ